MNCSQEYDPIESDKQLQNVEYYDSYEDEEYSRENSLDLLKDTNEDNSDVWDDSALIAAWDVAIKEYQSFHSVKATESINVDENNKINTKNRDTKKTQHFDDLFDLTGSKKTNKTSRKKSINKDNNLKQQPEEEDEEEKEEEEEEEDLLVNEIETFDQGTEHGKSAEQEREYLPKSKSNEGKKGKGQIPLPKGFKSTTSSSGGREYKSQSNTYNTSIYPPYTHHQQYPGYYSYPPPPPPPHNSHNSHNSHNLPPAASSSSFADFDKEGMTSSSSRTQKKQQGNNETLGEEVTEDYEQDQDNQQYHWPEAANSANSAGYGWHPNFFYPPPPPPPNYYHTEHYPNMQYPPRWSAKTPDIVPPIPPMIDDDSLKDLLMAWYFSGYYTGYYQAKKKR